MIKSILLIFVLLIGSQSFAHDMRYWPGGTFEQKAQADAELNRCVAEASLESHGALMEWGFFLGGGPMVSTRWRWGYGRNRLRP